VKKLTPIGKIILSVVHVTWRPIPLNNCANDSAKKLRYLKYSRTHIPKSTPIVVMFEALLLFRNFISFFNHIPMP
jgi:hypothetical protein